MEVRIADLKSRLSEHLRAVQRGETIDVFQRDTLVARIVPAQNAGQGLRRRPGGLGKKPLAEIDLPPRLRTKSDIVALLSEERGQR